MDFAIGGSGNEGPRCRQDSEREKGKRRSKDGIKLQEVLECSCDYVEAKRIETKVL
jgi:hypothetical protein